ncbi:Na(+)/H(+) exchange regulatory cofactor NHE-RF1 [Cimex lectularius]|uniref:PDZ domain-containing protein n=1 Tax=Cimex lectularius TaxID=79782 RepID=A0A8I6SA03_CIMLE|nr:Na(+)/H(+) exchange regulatory cofactor NHE-RF1 [Cimex lectularius]XP_014259741.1 Na(+)/H(+) exchange regulatory cofactor NHE-RF1 [Cimex lectularius]
MSTENLNANSLRLCHIFKWDSFDGYGFNLHAEKGKPGQYIGKVDEGSPAEAAGLKEGDRIIEVNGVDIANENHKQVVQRIKSLPEETKLLVVDAEGDNYFKSQNIVVDGSLACIVTIRTPPDPNSDSDHKIPEDSQSQKSNKSGRSSDYETSIQPQIITADKDNTDKNSHLDNSSTNEEQHNSLNLNMTAKELRAQLAARKKYDPKKDSTIDFKKKYDIVQKL